MVDKIKFYEGLKTIIPKLTPGGREILKESLKHAKNDLDFLHLLDWLKHPTRWRMPKVSVDTFLDDKFYLGIGDSVFPKVREICKEVIEGDYREGVEVAGIGSGKSFSAQILACYSVHHLLCLRNPHRTYRLANDKNITIMNMGINATQAWEVVFSGISSLVGKSPFFQQFRPKMRASSIRFEAHKVAMISGNSKASTALGYNIFYAILDEAAFYIDNENRSVAQDIYEALQRRIVSRFGNDGLLMMISSPRYIEDFIMKKLEESRLRDKDGGRENKHIYSIQLPTWKCRSSTEEEIKNKFFFNVRTNTILDDVEEEEIRRIYNVNSISDEDFSMEYDVWEVPGEYKNSFKQNPDKAKRDFGATPSMTLQGFFPNTTVLREAYNYDRKNPVVSPGKYKFDERPLRENYFIHVDIGFNREGRGDYTGFAMGRFGGWIYDDETGETRMKFYIDLVEKIGCAAGKGEVDLAEVRQRIYDLRSMGFNIRKVTLDGYMSKDFMQILRKRGIRSDYLSVDRTVDAYNILKESFYENRIDIPHVEFLDSELCRLELVRGVKVDHPPGGCFTGDTRVALIDGSNPTFEELAGRYKKGEEFEVYTTSSTGVTVGKARNPRITKLATELVGVTLDTGHTIRCTPDHRFLLLNGKYKEAQNLTAEDNLAHCIPGMGNRSIADVQWLGYGRDVWDITVANTHNFALESGVFVHNSKDCADAVAGVVMNIHENTPKSSIGVMAEQNRQIIPKSLVEHIDIREKERHYELMQELVNQQTEYENMFKW